MKAASRLRIVGLGVVGLAVAVLASLSVSAQKAASGEVGGQGQVTFT